MCQHLMMATNFISLKVDLLHPSQFLLLSHVLELATGDMFKLQEAQNPSTSDNCSCCLEGLMLHQHCRGLLKSKGLVAEEVVFTMINNGKPPNFVMHIGDDKSDECHIQILSTYYGLHMLSLVTIWFPSKHYLDVENVEEACYSYFRYLKDVLL